jgi:hypothetical protein
MPSFARRLAVLVALASGCSVHSLLNKLEDEGEKSVDLICSCTEVHPDRAQCEASLSTYFDLFASDCAEDALAEDKEGSKKTLECIVDRAKEYNRCLEDKLECSDPDSIQACGGNFDDDCPELPEAVQVELQACFADQ